MTATTRPSGVSWRLAAALAVTATTALCGAAPTFTSVPAPDLQPLFAQASTGSLAWLGADIATSLPLDDVGLAHLWLFGDTIIGRFRPNATRDIKGMPRNSVGVLYTAASGRPTSTLSHAWRYDASAAQHVGFFSPPANASQWYWPQQGLRVNNASFVVAWRMAPGPPGEFAFTTAGIDVIALPRYGDGGASGDPADWPAALPTTTIGAAYVHDNFTVGNSVAVDGGYVYLLGGVGSPSAAMMTRIGAADFVAQAWDRLTFLMADGSWATYVAGATEAGVRRLFDFVPSETTMTWVPALSAWLLLNVNTFITGADVTFRTTPDLAGGAWSAPTTIYTIPAPFLANGSFCYAGKAHPELAAPGGAELVWTFNCNTDGLPPLVNRTDMYLPRVVRTTWSA